MAGSSLNKKSVVRPLLEGHPKVKTTTAALARKPPRLKMITAAQARNPPRPNMNTPDLAGRHPKQKHDYNGPCWGALRLEMSVVPNCLLMLLMLGQILFGFSVLDVSFEPTERKIRTKSVQNPCACRSRVSRSVSSLNQKSAKNPPKIRTKSVTKSAAKSEAKSVQSKQALDTATANKIRHVKNP